MGRLGRGIVIVQTIDFCAKFVDILKATIYRCKADIGHLVELAQLAHNLIADLSGIDLTLASRAQALADLFDGRFDRLDADGALLERPCHTGTQLGRIEALAGAVGLDDSRHDQFGRLVRRKALMTRQALAASANLIALRHQTRVTDLGFMRTAEGTMHGNLPGFIIVFIQRRAR
ncbi:arginine/ornithine N-succinyltransferase [Zymobacter palmae]|uniref:Arginine/ornithine N-succinyltransferase n=1 Tax=Zymobacter palmae TaxID=33074 RepID=A0A348HH54_9GAMM|nr:arginine/ornithine N-succinyltransferase [Zymobacter palmae]